MIQAKNKENVENPQIHLLSNIPTIDLLPLIEKAFALGQKRFRLRAKNLFDQGRKVKK